MSNFISDFFECKEQAPLHKIILGLLGIVIVRIFIENFSSPSPLGYFFSWKDSYLHFPIYYTSVFLSFSLLLYFFTKDPLMRIFNFQVKLFLLVWLPPIVDLITTRGKGATMAYIVTSPQNFLKTFFKLMDPRGYYGITLGIHVAAYLILFFMAWYIFHAKKSLSLAIIGAFAGYVILFFYAITPSIISIPQLYDSHLASATDAYSLTIKQSWILTTAQKNITDSLKFQDLSTLQSEPITLVFYILLVLQLLVSFKIIYPKIFSEFARNARFERILFWSLIACLGIAINFKQLGNNYYPNLINILFILDFFILIAVSIWLAICINDKEDIAIDIITCPQRPLANNAINISEWNGLTLFLLALFFIGVAIMNATVGYLFILAEMAYYIYSARPLRLKRHFLFSSLLIGLVAVAITMAGFFLVSPDQHFRIFPIQISFLIFFSFAAISNFKDIKDYKGDKIENIKTIPVVLGYHLSKQIIAFIFASVFITIPLLANLGSMIPVSILCSVFIYYLLTKDHYKEKYIFYLFFLYMIGLLISYIRL